MNRIWKNDFGSLVPGLRLVHCEVATTTGGTLATTQKQYGLKLVKTSGKTGRYTCQLIKSDGSNDNAVGLVNIMVGIVGPDDSAFTDAKGMWLGGIRDIDIGAGANDGTVEIQLQDVDSEADANPEDGAILLVTLFLKESNVAA